MQCMGALPWVGANLVEKELDSDHIIHIYIYILFGYIRYVLYNILMS